jgi:hypothetical protein
MAGESNSDWLFDQPVLSNSNKRIEGTQIKLAQPNIIKSYKEVFKWNPSGRSN